jgi:hypothetical protein
MTAPKGAGATIVSSMAAPKTRRGSVGTREDVYGIDGCRDEFLLSLARIAARRLRQQTEAEAGHRNKKEQR